MSNTPMVFDTWAWWQLDHLLATVAGTSRPSAPTVAPAAPAAPAARAGGSSVWVTAPDGVRETQCQLDVVEMVPKGELTQPKWGCQH